MTNFVVCGTGFGREHCRAIDAAGGNVTAVVYRSDALSAQALADAYSAVLCTTEFDEALALAPDWVTVCTPPSSHLELASRCLETGVGLVLDKPVGLDPTESGDLAGRVAQPGRAFVSFQWRLSDALRLLRRHAERDLGTLFHLSLAFSHDFLLDQRTVSPWRHDVQEAGSGVLGDIGVHMFDLLRWFTGREWTVVSTNHARKHLERRLPSGGMITPSTEDWAAVALTDETRMVSSVVEVDRASHRGRFFDVRIEGSEGTASANIDLDSGKWVVKVPGRTEEADDDPLTSLYEAICSGDGVARELASLSDGHAAQVMLEHAASNTVLIDNGLTGGQ